MENNEFIVADNGPTYTCTIDGNVGRFKTSAGEVVFLQTRARLAMGDVSSSARLTSLLTPAREALDVRKMDFNQLLQRDLDDHRIAHELVPYILKPQDTGPAFFPPILAALLPFEKRQPKEELPPLEFMEAQDDPQFPNLKWNISKVGEVFSLQELCNISGNKDSRGAGILRWNDELAKLVIMDGQHRAMALLAIFRTLTNTWSATSSSGERYRSFYETKINNILRELDNEQPTVNFESLEFPVTICLFPEYVGPNKNPHIAARKLFVDVNKEAKPPSESRLILLSDTRLDHILAREILNRLRNDIENNYMPLYTVEYDNPNPKKSTPRRWSAVTNLEIFLRAIDYCCFGPEEVVSEVNRITSVKGKPNISAKSAYFRTQMKLQDILEASIEDGPRKLYRHEIGVDLFPIYNQKARKVLLNKFYDSWGKGLVRLFSEIEPYKAHIQAVRDIYNGWLGGSVAGDLAKEALFEGVGMFWTLEEGYKHWREETSRHENDLKPPETEVCHAWKIADDTKKKEFERLRCKYYLGKHDEASVTSSNAFYNIAITYAAQVGLALTWALLRKHNRDVDSDKILDSVILAINKSLVTGPVQTRDRKLFLSKDENDKFNLLQKLDAPFAAYFRFFWLELIMVEDNHECLCAAGIDIDNSKYLLDEGRRFFVKKIVDDYINTYKSMEDLSISKAQKIGTEKAVKALVRAYKKWFGLPATKTEEMVYKIINNGNADDEIDDEVNSDDIRI